MRCDQCFRAYLMVTFDAFNPKIAYVHLVGKYHLAYG